MNKPFKRKLLIAFTALTISIMVTGYSKNEKAIDTSKLETNLKNISYEFNYSNQKDMLAGSKKVIPVGNENITLYSYNNPSSMKKDADTISRDGNIVGNSMVEWSSKPHFYKHENSIVQYIGNDKQVIGVLNKVLGNQFAGQ